MTIVEARHRLEASLATPALNSKDNVFRLVASQLAEAEDSWFHEVVQNRCSQVWDLLELLRSASGEENHNLLVSAEDDVHSDGWKLKQDTGQLRVMYREGPKGTPYHTLLAEGLVYSPITSALCLAWEAPSYTLWWPQMTIPPFKVIESKWVKRGFNGEDISLIRVKVPWPLAAREVVMCAFELEVFDEELVIVLLHSFPETEECNKVSGIPDPLPNIVRMELVGGFALQRVSPEQSYFRTVANLDIKLEFVPPWLINFISRQLIGLGYKLYQKTLSSINKGEGNSKHFQDLIQTEPMYERIRKGLQLRKDKEATQKKVEDKEIHVTDYSEQDAYAETNIIKKSDMKEIIQGSEPIYESMCEFGSSYSDNVEDPSNNDAHSSVDPEVQKALNVLDRMISLVQSRKVGGAVVDVSADDNTSYRTATQPNCTQDMETLNMGQAVPRKVSQINEKKHEDHSRTGSSEVQITYKHSFFYSFFSCCRRRGSVKQ
ncbi:hypothetical protein KP509_27G043600 [Ceratopteris richardii]|uniref:START domain-containing protein n=1 Tax=Ceratopteris richardii TaxID=49495 RepID=A0A8T2RIF2_CERRI|nr:hypothetical protein KP509_27G043600 [Ceratopteris richardii]